MVFLGGKSWSDYKSSFCSSTIKKDLKFRKLDFSNHDEIGCYFRTLFLNGTWNRHIQNSPFFYMGQDTSAKKCKFYSLRYHFKNGEKEALFTYLLRNTIS